jgi:DNA-binding PucR family transcriptional regulator
MRGITELLDVDFEDPDQRLALQLACRAPAVLTVPARGRPARR